ncbi:MAG: YdcF family protein [Gammaproteobacteria bacterium]|nr:YdcF family protein [Gammaproteobacteria bacterium]
MYVYLSKILPLFVMPLGIALLFLFVALLILRTGRRRLGSGVVLLAFVWIWVMATPIVGEGLLRRVESAYPPPPMAVVPTANCIIVLGGVVEAPAPPRIDVEFNDAIDRVHKAAELFHAGKAPYLIVTGGNQPWSNARASEAELIRDLLISWKVPKEVIMLEGSSRNTRENALYTKNMVDSINCEEALLVTSAAHMPRSLAAFRAAGITATPVSTDVRAAETDQITVIDFLPDARALEKSSDAMREMVGQWFYELKGWN